MNGLQFPSVAFYVPIRSMFEHNSEECKVMELKLDIKMGILCYLYPQCKRIEMASWSE